MWSKDNYKISDNCNALISVIVPAYNAEQYLRECLDSIVAQTFTNWELIFVDDGSTDSTEAIIKEYAHTDCRIKYLFQSNQGVSAARNAGLNAAQGEFVVFVDADDALFPTALQQLFDVSRTTGADYVIGGIRRGKRFSTKPAFRPSSLTPSLHYSLNRSHQHLPTRLHHSLLNRLHHRLLKHTQHRSVETSVSNRATLLQPLAAAEALLYQKIDATSAWGVLVRRDHFDTLKFRPGRYEDLDITYRLVLQSKLVALLREEVYFYRQHRQSFIHTISRARLDVLDVTDRMVEYISANYPRLIDAATDRRFAAHCNILILTHKALIRRMLTHNKLIRRMLPHSALIRRMLTRSALIRKTLAHGALKSEACAFSKQERAEIIQRCHNVIVKSRKKELTNSRVRLKNKLGALLSYVLK